MSEPSRVRRQLGAELRGVRKLAGLTQRQLQELIGILQARMSLIESGKGNPPSRAEVGEWLAVCGASSELRERVAALLEAAHTESRAYRELLDGGHLQGDVAADEAAARLVRTYQTSIVPGLLQTAAYATVVAPQVDPTGQVDVAAFVAARVARQRLLYEAGRRFEFLIAEHVLYWAPGPGVMPAQLDHIASLATLPTVELAVLPTRREGVYDWHGFVYTEPADEGGPVVTTELLGGYWSTSDAAITAVYAQLWADLWKVAVHGDDALRLVRAAR